MSIIYEALKKTEKMLVPKPDSTGATADKKKSRREVEKFALYALMIFLGLAMGSQVLKLFNRPVVKPISSPLPQEKQQAAQRPESIAQITPPPAPEVKKEPEKPLVLNGIFFSQDQGYALINNKIVKTGDTVDGVKVLRITANEVELDSDGNTIKLSR